MRPPAFLSFSRAAEELHLTREAISRAVRQLEEYLGVDPFKRGTRSVSLTSAGAAYAANVRDVLDRLAKATAELRECRLGGVLTVSTLDSFAAKWLVSRLFRFRRAHSELDVRLLTTERLVDFASEDVDHISYRLVGVAQRCGHRGRRYRARGLTFNSSAHALQAAIQARAWCSEAAFLPMTMSRRADWFGLLR
jgi:hypothetical protein